MTRQFSVILEAVICEFSVLVATCDDVTEVFVSLVSPCCRRLYRSDKQITTTSTILSITISISGQNLRDATGVFVGVSVAGLSFYCNVNCTTTTSTDNSQY